MNNTEKTARHLIDMYKVTEISARTASPENQEADILPRIFQGLSLKEGKGHHSTKKPLSVRSKLHTIQKDKTRKSCLKQRKSQIKKKVAFAYGSKLEQVKFISTPESSLGSGIKNEGEETGSSQVVAESHSVMDEPDHVVTQEFDFPLDKVTDIPTVAETKGITYMQIGECKLFPVIKSAHQMFPQIQWTQFDNQLSKNHSFHTLKGWSASYNENHPKASLSHLGRNHLDSDSNYLSGNQYNSRQFPAYSMSQRKRKFDEQNFNLQTGEINKRMCDSPDVSKPVSTVNKPSVANAPGTPTCVSCTSDIPKHSSSVNNVRL